MECATGNMTLPSFVAFSIDFNFWQKLASDFLDPVASERCLATLDLLFGHHHQCHLEPSGSKPSSYNSSRSSSGGPTTLSWAMTAVMT